MLCWIAGSTVSLPRRSPSWEQGSSSTGLRRRRASAGAAGSGTPTWIGCTSRATFGDSTAARTAPRTGGGGRLAAPPGSARPALAAAQVAGRLGACTRTGACARSGGRLAQIATAGGAGRRRAAVLDAAQARQALLREGAGEQRRHAGSEQEHAGKRRQGDRPLGFHGPHCSARTKTGPPDGAEWLTGLQRGRLMGSNTNGLYF